MKNRKKLILGLALTILTVFCIYGLPNEVTPETAEEVYAAATSADNDEETQKTAEKSEEEEDIELTSSMAIKQNVSLDVPLVEQMAEPSLYNGCEVTSLAMLLNYFDVDVTKNELADAIPKVDYMDSAGNYGNPNEGFVGDITGESGPGYFVYHEPVYELAQTYATENLNVLDFTGEDFSVLQAYLSQGSPIWVITTTTFAKTSNTDIWQTESGNVLISMQEHSVVITGYDSEYVYLNDPYGNKNYKTDLEDFITSWEQMGSQAITITEN